MTEKQAFRAMFIYLDECFRRDPTMAVGQVLGELQLLEDGRPAVPAAIDDWKRAIE